MAGMRKRLVSIGWGILTLLAAAGPVQANEVEFDPYVVHYTVVNTHFLSPEVARSYDLRRSRSRALVNVVIMKREGEALEPVSGKVAGQAVNLYGQVRHLRFREVRDGAAFYNLAEVRIRPGEVLDFSLRVSADGDARVMPVNFRQVFYDH
jgi:hypothetical protein